MNIETPPTEEPHETPANIIGINGTLSEDLEIRLAKEEQSRKCAAIHKAILVNARDRSVTCSICGNTIDAFDYLMAWAREGEHRMEALKNIETKRKVAWAEWKLLDNRIKNHRATLKRAGMPQPVNEHRLFDSIELNHNDWHRHYIDFLNALTDRLNAETALYKTSNRDLS